MSKLSLTVIVPELFEQTAFNDPNVGERIRSLHSAYRDRIGLHHRLVLPVNKDAVIDSEIYRELANLPAELASTLFWGSGSKWELINQAVANSVTDAVLIVEDFAIPERKFRASLNRLVDNLNKVRIWQFPIAQSIGSVEEALSGKKAIPSSLSQDAEKLGAYIIHRELFLHLRGYTEEQRSSASADVDLFDRLRRFGVRRSVPIGFGFLRTVPPNSKNKVQVKDRLPSSPLYANLEQWSVRGCETSPLITIAVSTFNRGEMLVEALESIKAQSFQDFEVIVVDDGSEDYTAREVVASLDDPRFRYIRKDNGGVSSARNIAADHSRGYFTAVHDDDDLMLPNRLLYGLRAIKRIGDASFGSWINFDNETGGMARFVTTRTVGETRFVHNGESPGHSTWLVPTHLVKLARYDETITAAVDNNLFQRLVSLGVNWVHCEEFVLLRRVHDHQISKGDVWSQKSGHIYAMARNSFMASPDSRNSLALQGSKNQYPKPPGLHSLKSTFTRYLPDSLVSRDVVINDTAEDVFHSGILFDSQRELVEIMDLKNLRTLSRKTKLKNVSYEGLADLQRANVKFLVETGVMHPRPTMGGEDGSAPPIPSESVEIEKAEHRSGKLRDLLETRMKLCCSKNPDLRHFFIWENCSLSHDALDPVLSMLDPKYAEQILFVQSGDPAIGIRFYAFEELGLLIGPYRELSEKLGNSIHLIAVEE